MKLTLSLILVNIVFYNQPVLAVKTGEVAPTFESTGHDGETYKLTDYKGRKFVVLEWYNNDCPFVGKHYDSNNMQSLQHKYTQKGVVWLSIISSAPGKQGHVDAQGATVNMEARKAKPTAVLLDSSGKIGKLYSAKTTPHMYIIDKTGTLVYQGAIDNIPSPFQFTDRFATPVFANALDAILDGKLVEEGTTKPYGCSVHYE